MRFRRYIKHLFIPHKENDFKPHFFREAAISSMLLISVFLLGVSFCNFLYLSTTQEGARISSSVLIDITNTLREDNHKPRLRYNPLLEDAAILKGIDMAEKGYFAHYGPDGTSPWYFMKKAGYPFLFAGENLAVDFKSSYGIAKGWIESKSHRENLLNDSFEEIGVATVRGYYHYYPSIYVVQMFGTQGGTTSTLAEASPHQERYTSQDSLITSTQAPSSVGMSGYSDVVAYSTWVERMLFKGSWYISGFYKLLFGVILLALFIMIFIEIRRQHFLHILYGVLLLGIIALFMYINQSFY